MKTKLLKYIYKTGVWSLVMLWLSIVALPLAPAFGEPLSPAEQKALTHYTNWVAKKCGPTSDGSDDAGAAGGVSDGRLVWPFATKSKAQYDRVDQGWDIQTKPKASVYAIAPGTIHVYNPDPGMFGNDYPTEELDTDIGGPSKFIYYGHVHVLPEVNGKHVEAGQKIAITNGPNASISNPQNGSGAPPGWLEIGFAQPGTDAPVADSIPSPEGQKMKDLLINTQPSPLSAGDPADSGPGTDSTQQAGCCSGGGEGSDSLVGESVPEQLFNFFVGNGFTPEQAAGMLGNIAHEGVFDPTNIEDPAGHTKDPAVIASLSATNQGYGLVGWTPGNSLLTILKTAGITDPPYTVLAQAKAIVAELDGKVPAYVPAQVGKDIKNAKTVEEATTAFQGNQNAGGPYLGFERPADEVSTLPDRIASAKKFLKKFGNGTTGAAADADAQSNSCTCSAGGAAGDVTLTGNNAKDAFNYFVSKKLSPEAAAGLVGNFQQESGETLNTRADNGSHTGIAQWDTGGRWASLVSYEKGKGNDPYDIAAQLDYVWHELNGSYKSTVLEPLKKTTDVNEAAKIVNDYYEIVFDGTLPTRQANAKTILNKYGGGGSVGDVGNLDCEASGAAGENGWDLKGPNAMVYYGQCDPKWANHPYGAGKSSICEGGCGITSMAMVVATLSAKGKDETPKTMADKYGGTYHTSGGTSWGLWPVAARDFGLNEKDIGTDLSAAADTVKNGGLVIISVDPGAFTSGGHIMVIRAVTDKGEFLLADPNNDGNKSLGRGDTNDTPYSADFLRTQGSLKHLWAFTR